MTKIARQIRIRGCVQGVGFRPFIDRLARQMALTGWVRNQGGEVVVHVEGDSEAFTAFLHALVSRPPPLARPAPPVVEPADLQEFSSFRILPSLDEEASIYVPPDGSACAECLAELRDPADRRYRYSFINCTQCGPRNTIIDRLPYDRPNTVMAGFPLCPSCRAEYEDPGDRRYHAQPWACPACGPKLRFHASASIVAGNEHSLSACIRALREGKIVAVKGIGGYHLVCAVHSDAAVLRLRKRKHRPAKPFAVLLPDAVTEESLEDLGLAASPQEWELLRSPQRPIVLLRTIGRGISRWVAPGLRETGVLLPYSPLHHLLAEGFGGPLVATSANRSSEPVLTDPVLCEAKLGAVADAFLHHDRPILRPADDSVFRTTAGKPRPLRLGRGLTPLELRLARPVAMPTLALGADFKNTIALAVEDRVIPPISAIWDRRAAWTCSRRCPGLQPPLPHRPAAPRVRRPSRFLFQALGRTQRGYRSTGHGLPPSCPRIRPVWRTLPRGSHTGLRVGRGRLRSGSNPVGWRSPPRGTRTMAAFRQSATFPPAGRRQGPARTLALRPGLVLGNRPGQVRRERTWTAKRRVPERGQAMEGLSDRCSFAPTGVGTKHSMSGDDFRRAAVRGCRGPPGGLREQSYEGQAGMMMEAIAESDSPILDLPMYREQRVWRIDWSPLLPMLMESQRSAAERGSCFHASLARAILLLAEQARAERRIGTVGLAGGVFQNRVLTEQTLALLERAGFETLLPEIFPVNDAAISFGQIVEIAFRS